jgi:monomeric sarcosine oxidase
MANTNSPPPSGSRFDIIVVGGGTIGLSAAYYAAARGRTTLLLEQYDRLAHPHASSDGYSRFFRIMHSSEYMARLAEATLALWQEIETASGEKILKWHPLLFYGKSETTPEGDLGNMRKILSDLGVPFQWYESGAALAKAFPVFNFEKAEDTYIGLMQCNSAVIRAEKSIAAFRQLAEREGAILLMGQQAVVSMSKGVYEVTCAAGTYSAPGLILAPSAWTNHVLRSFHIELDLSIWQMTVAYFTAQVDEFNYPFWYEFGPIGPNRKFAAGATIGQTKLDSDDHQDLFYGFPPDEKPGRIKVSCDYTYKHKIYCDPSKLTFEPDPHILSQIGDFVDKRFKGVDRNPTDCTTCLYTMSKDFQMVLDTLPGHRNAAIFTGDSGRGFKFTPLVGRVLVDLATAGSTGYDISPFRISRAGIIKSGTA